MGNFGGGIAIQFTQRTQGLDVVVFIELVAAEVV
jgi:hypothetical protein